MRNFYFIVLIVLVASCSEDAIKIKTYDEKKVDTDSALIKTTRVEIEEETKEIPKEPEINIISPKDGEVINGSTIIVKLDISNFKLVTPDKYPKKEQGHVQVWVDNMEQRSSKTVFVFENESNGTHWIKAELMLSNNTVLPYSRTIKVIVNKTY